MHQKPHLDLDPAIGIIDGDERKVKQVVFNLLSNALKFTPDGGQVLVTARLIGGEVQVAIQDTGMGIPREDWARIFEPLQQAGYGPGTSHEGTGLGLTLSRQCIELHGGRLWMESEPDMEGYVVCRQLRGNPASVVSRA